MEDEQYESVDPPAERRLSREEEAVSFRDEQWPGTLGEGAPQIPQGDSTWTIGQTNQRQLIKV